MARTRLSRAAREAIAAIEARSARVELPGPGDLAGWAALFERQEAAVAPAVDGALHRYRPALRTLQLGPLPALVVTPATLSGERARIVFLHGGAYTLFSARSTLFASAPLAHDLGLELWSIDYPRAPQFRHDRTVPLVREALASACGDGTPVLLVGDSAGGGLALAATRRLLEAGGRAPAALAVWSPWADLAASGESRAALAALDPVLRQDPELNRAALAYAPADRLGDPDVSPLRAQYDPRFPPTLIQCGSREILLPDAVGLHHVLAKAGVRTELDLHPGMVHSYPAILPGLPEARAARRRLATFFFRLLSPENGRGVGTPPVAAAPRTHSR